MAGWAKYECHLPDKAEVRAIAAAVQKSRFSVSGRLMSIWAWAQEHTTTGRVEPCSPEIIDDVVELPGFAAAMAKYKWLIVGDGFVVFPRWKKHNGSGAKRRAEDQKRKRRERSEPRPHHVRNVSAKRPQETGTREEKRREREEETKTPSPTPSAAAEIPQAWQAVGGALYATIAVLLGRQPLATRAESQRLEDWLICEAGKPAQVTIKGEKAPREVLATRAIEVLEQSRIGGAVSSMLKYLDSVIERAEREQLWPNEFRASQASATFGEDASSVVDRAFAKGGAA